MTLLAFRTPEPALEVKPDGVAAVRRSGPFPHKLLMFGGAALRGLGLRNHNLGLPGHTADTLTGRTGQGIELDVIVEPDPTSTSALTGLPGLRLRRYDSILIFLSERPALSGVRPDEWRKQLERLIITVRNEASPHTSVLVCDTTKAMLNMPRGATGSRRSHSHAQRLTELSGQVAVLLGAGFIELQPLTTPIGLSSSFSGTTYAGWAETITSTLQPKLRALDSLNTPDTPRAFRHRPDAEAPRQRALTHLLPRAADREPMLDFIALQAKVMFRASEAYINIIDAELQWAQAGTVGQLPTVPRDIAFCNHTIQTDSLTLINDSHRDARFQGNPLTEGPDGIRFYAGYPIHSWDGYRIGALCIVDTVPRTMLPTELAPLHDFAGRIEQELWNAALRTPASRRTAQP